MKQREYIEWHDIWVTGADDKVIPRVLLVGDSIVCSYFAIVEEELKGTFLCARMATSTCVADQGIVKELGLLLDNYRFVVIHFNNGLHGWGYDEAAYAKGLSDTLDFVIERAPQSRLILATTTPMRQKGNLSAFAPETERVRERNRRACEIAMTRQIAVNDLFGAVVDCPEYFSDDGVHLNQQGRSILGKQVAHHCAAGGCGRGGRAGEIN